MSLTKRYLIVLAVLATCAVLLPLAAADSTTSAMIPVGPGPVIIDTTAEPTQTPFTPVTQPTTEPTTIPTTEPTVTVPTIVTQPTTEPTTIPTKEPTVTVPTIVTQPTTEPTTIPTTEPTRQQPTSVGGGKGWIDTYCNVDGATVYFDNQAQGTINGGILSVPVSPTASPISTISVSKSGYTTWSGPLSHMPADQEHVAVYATINPLPTQTTTPPVQNGAIYAQSTPNGAQIYMNGNFYGYSPVTIPNLPPGTYSMKASLAGYSPDTSLITVNAGQTAFYSPVLQPSPTPPRSTGTVYVTSNPNNALIYVDGAYMGKTPLTLTLYSGSHTFQLTLTGYNNYVTTLYVNPGSSQNLNAVMTSAIYGSVSITTVPGASVYMDSSSMGKIPASGVLTLNNIASGNHLFKITSPGYNDWMNTVYVRANTVTPITVALTPLGPNPTQVPATGGLNIVSTPTGAEVYVDNLFKGYTPAVLDGITPGQHQVLLRSTGYLDYTTTVAVNPGQTTPLAVSMQPAPTPTPQSAPSLALLIAGIAGITGLGAILRRRT